MHHLADAFEVLGRVLLDRRATWFRVGGRVGQRRVEGARLRANFSIAGLRDVLVLDGSLLRFGVILRHRASWAALATFLNRIRPRPGADSIPPREATEPGWSTTKIESVRRVRLRRGSRHREGGRRAIASGFTTLIGAPAA
jgi:hypothetical protein